MPSQNTYHVGRSRLAVQWLPDFDVASPRVDSEVVGPWSHSPDVVDKTALQVGVSGAYRRRRAVHLGVLRHSEAERLSNVAWRLLVPADGDTYCRLAGTRVVRPLVHGDDLELQV